MFSKLPLLTIEEVVAIVKRKGQIEVNPLKYRKWRGTGAAFGAAKLGLLKKHRINCGRFIFTLPTKPVPIKAQ